MSRLPNPRLALRLASLLWLICTLLPMGTAYLVQQEWGTSALDPTDFLFFGGGFAALLFGGSFLAPLKLERVLPTYLLMGMGFSAFLALTIGVGGAFVLAPTISLPAKLTGVGLVLVSAVFWCLRALNACHRRFLQLKVIDREFTVQETRIVMRHPMGTDLETLPANNGTPWGKLYNGVGPYLVMAIPVAYPLQRLLGDTGGLTSVLLLLFALCIPLTLHILGRMSSGAYLWIYRVWQLEREHGKPVVFDVAE